MWITREYVVFVVLLTLVSRSALMWLVRLIAQRNIPYQRPCPACGAVVEFRRPLKLPTRADVIAAAAGVVQVAAAAEGIPAGPPPELVAPPWDPDCAGRRSPEPVTAISLGPPEDTRP